MQSLPFAPRQGGVKVVFDVREQDAIDLASQVEAAGFVVRRYYPRGGHRRRGSPSGFVRLGAERAMSEFTNAERDRIVTAFQDVQRAIGFACERIGVDTWTAT